MDGSEQAIDSNVAAEPGGTGAAQGISDPTPFAKRTCRRQ